MRFNPLNSLCFFTPLGRLWQHPPLFIRMTVRNDFAFVADIHATSHEADKLATTQHWAQRPKTSFG
jgi:ABC-type sulfate/molybdate transport systems ATPase subunit